MSQENIPEKEVNKKIDEALEASLKNAQMAKETNRKTTDAPPEKKDEKEEKDAEKWRNEG